jgi:uncharacterized Rmd1/YagE family protein
MSSPPTRRAQRFVQGGMFGSFDDSSLPSSIRERQRLLHDDIEDDAAYSDSEQTAPRWNPPGDTRDEFGDNNETRYDPSKGTGRLRKKFASRGKGGAFSEKKQKRRIYSCCIGSEVDTGKLHEHLDALPAASSPLGSSWTSELYTDTLHISRRLDAESTAAPASAGKADAPPVTPPPLLQPGGTTIRPAFNSTTPVMETPEKDIIATESTSTAEKENVTTTSVGLYSAKFHFSIVKEIFVFEFGAVVFWGFSIGEEKEMLKLIRGFVSEELSIQERELISEDDMAFVLVMEETEVLVVSDILYLPEHTVTKQRLAMSFALGQSTVLSVFESQVVTKIPEYNHIPETLAASGRINNMSSRDVNKLVGELFVIRHKLNLHSDILDIPDFFWAEDRFEREYKSVWKYLEMDLRVSVLNKRLNLIKEMLDLLSFHVDRSESNGLDWIVIILIVIYCFIEVAGIIM